MAFFRSDYLGLLLLRVGYLKKTQKTSFLSKIVTSLQESLGETLRIKLGC